MNLQRKYGYVDISSPFVDGGNLATPMNEMSFRVEEMLHVDPWPGMTFERRPLSHIQFLLIVVLLLSGLAVWMVFQPGKVASASGQQLSAGSTFSRSSGSGPTDGFSDSNTPEIGSAEKAESVGQLPGKEVGRLSPVFTPEVRYWEQQILRWAAEYDVDPNIVGTIMQIESCGNPGAASYAGAQGLFQVMPFHFLAGEDMLDPDTNAMRGLAFFREQMRYTGGDVFLSFAGYNGGYAASGGAYENWAAETQRYYYWAKGIYLDASVGADHSDRLDEWLVAGGGGGCHIAASVLGI